MAVNSVEEPARRRLLMDVLAQMSDREYQERVWLGGAGERGRDDSWAEVVLILYQDREILPDPPILMGPFSRSPTTTPQPRTTEASAGEWAELGWRLRRSLPWRTSFASSARSS